MRELGKELGLLVVFKVLVLWGFYLKTCQCTDTQDL